MDEVEGLLGEVVGSQVDLPGQDWGSRDVKRIYRKLSVDSRVALTRLALRPLV